MAFSMASTPPPLQALFAAQTAPVCYLQGGEILAFGNPAFEALWNSWGLGPIAEALGAPFPPAALEVLAPMCEHVRRSGAALFQHGVVSHGAQRWDVHAVPYMAGLGHLEGTLLFFFPAAPDAQELGLIVDQLTDGVLVVSPQGEIRLANAAARAMLSLTMTADLGDLERLDMRDLDGHPIAASDMPISRVLRGEQVRDVYLRIETSAASRVLSASAIPLLDPAGKVQAGVVLLHDATEVYRLREALLEKVGALEHALASLRELDRLKGDFLNTVSHELRTPLSTIVGYVEFLEEGIGGPLSPQQHEFLGCVAQSANHLMALINDMLDVTALQAGRLRFSFSPFRLDQLAAEMLAPWVAAGQAKGVTVSIRPGGPVPLVQGDYARTRKVIDHLLDNALKFTASGGNVSVCVEPCGPDDVRLMIEDTGIGIPREAQAQLFTMFFQVESGLRRAQGGAGLGLYVSKLLVEAQGGEIGVTSETGRGTRIWFTLPVWQEP